MLSVREAVRRRGADVLAVAVIVWIVAAACASDDPRASAGGAGAAATDPGSVEGRRFVAKEATERGASRTLVGQVTIDFTQPGKVGVGTGCNNGSGAGQIEGGRLVTESLVVTAAGCPPAFVDQESFVLNLVTAKPAVSLAGDELVLHTDTAALRLLDRRVADPDRPLEATRWTIEGTLDGQVGTSVGRLGFLVFQGGWVTGSTGCRALEGPADISGAQITFGLLALTGAPCGTDQAPTETTVLHVLRGPVRADITARSLQLTAPDGTGITLATD